MKGGGGCYFSLLYLGFSMYQRTFHGWQDVLDWKWPVNCALCSSFSSWWSIFHEYTVSMPVMYGFLYLFSALHWGILRKDGYWISDLSNKQKLISLPWLGETNTQERGKKYINLVNSTLKNIQEGSVRSRKFSFWSLLTFMKNIRNYTVFS